jgi:phage gp36-like protein
MSYLSTNELGSHLNPETVDVISRSDINIAIEAIAAAMEEARGYLAVRYSTEKIFAARGKKRNAILLLFVKDIAVWHFINLGNAATDMDFRQGRYERAIEWLTGIMKGAIMADLPPKEADSAGAPGRNNPLGDIAFGSNPKRGSHY